MTEVNLSDHFTLTVNGETRDIKMTFGLLNEVSRQIGDIEAVPEISYNPDLREAVLITLLSERDDTGRILENFSVFTMEAETDAVVDLLDWAGSHVADFLLKSLTKAKAMVKSREATFKALMPT